MSLAKARQALEVRLAALTPALDTAWENVVFAPKDDEPFQEVRLLPNDPDNASLGGAYYRERGILQIEMAYPLQKGAKAAQDRAILTQNHFKRGTVLTAGGVNVTVETTPAIGPGFIAHDRWRVPVSVRWYAEITS
jgi:hypothetical protein